MAHRSYRRQGSQSPSRYRPEVCALDPRVVPAVSGLTLSASPAILVHINPMNQPQPLPTGPFVPVTFVGTFNATGTATPTVRYRVIDEYGHDQPTGTALLQGGAAPGQFSYSQRIGLILRRNLGDPDGRQYTIVVTVSDGSGSQTASTVVTVPHSRLRPGLLHHSLTTP